MYVHIFFKIFFATTLHLHFSLKKFARRCFYFGARTQLLVCKQNTFPKRECIKIAHSVEDGCELQNESLCECRRPPH